MTVRLLRCLPAALCTITLAGCGMNGGGVTKSASAPAAGAHALQGRIFGGQQPVAGASLQLYAVGTTGDGSAAAPLLTSAVRSDAAGNFNITGQYSCASNPSQLVYLVATGGDAGTGNNPALAMMTALGPCSGLTPSSFIQMDERTTVAAVAALAPFMTAANAVGSTSLDSASLSGAFTLATSLVSPSTGAVPGPSLPANASSPAALINTLADAIAACINSDGSTVTGTACARLFSATTESGSATTPTNTVSALLNLMRDPAMNTAGIYDLVSPSAPFQPQLASAPPSFAVALGGSGAPAALPFGCSAQVATGQNAFVDYTTEQPQSCRKLTAADLPAPYSSNSASNYSTLVARANGQMPTVPPGFSVTLYASLSSPRALLTAPNGDIFAAQSGANGLAVLRGVTAAGTVQELKTYTSGLNYPYGMAFYPSGSNPQYLYVANTTSVVRFPYANGDTVQAANPTTLISDLPSGGHATRGLVFTADGQHMLVTVGSANNLTNTDTDTSEFHRADVLSYTPAGTFESVYAYGTRNPVNITLDSAGVPWITVNERDGLGDNLPADYVTHLQAGGFYGWPWYYNGANAEPRLPNSHPELASQTIVGDVLLQPHFAPLQLAFYNGTAFPQGYRGDLFVASHGSWNKATRGGYELLRVIMNNGVATGAYEDFMTGFVNADGTVWGRPAAVAVGKDGALYVGDDGANCIWRITYTGAQ